MKFIAAINAIGANAWAGITLALGCLLFSLHEREGALMLVGGGLTLLKTPHEGEPK